MHLTIRELAFLRPCRRRWLLLDMRIYQRVLKALLREIYTWDNNIQLTARYSH